MIFLVNMARLDKLECKLKRVHFKEIIKFILFINFIEAPQQKPKELRLSFTKTYLTPKMRVITFRALMFVIDI